MAFEFATATRVIFGAGKVAQVAEIAAGLGKHVLIVASVSSSDKANKISQQLAAQQAVATLYTVGVEPDVAMIEDGVQAARNAGCDVVIGVGGGSVIDAGK